MSADISQAFQGLADQAMQMDLNPPAESTPVQAQPEPTVVETQAQSQDPSPEPAESQEPTPVDIGPDTPVKIKVDGVEKVVKMKDYQEILQRTDVFTQRQQALAKQRTELEQYYVQREAQVQQAIRAIQQAQAQMQPQQAQPQTTPANPQEIATIGEMQQALQALAQQYEQARQFDQKQVQQMLEQKAQQVKEDLAVVQDQQRFNEAISKVLSSEDGQLLAEISPEAEQQLRYRTMQMGPQDVHQAIDFLSQISKEWAGKIGASSPFRKNNSKLPRRSK